MGRAGGRSYGRSSEYKRGKAGEKEKQKQKEREQKKRSKKKGCSDAAAIEISACSTGGAGSDVAVEIDAGVLAALAGMR